MAIYVYYDGSGKSEDKNTAIITLSGIAATEELWPEFESLWSAMLQRHSVQALHMTDLMGCHGEYVGWTHKQQRALLMDGFNVLGHFGARQMWAASASVSMPDYHRAKLEIPKLREPESICVNYCCGGIGVPSDYVGKERFLLLYFDRNEKFMHKINRVWQRFKDRHDAGWPRQIINIIPADHSYKPIQAADMLAWVVNHHHRGLDRSGGIDFFSACLMVNHSVKLYEYAEIVEL